jgi:hypothetical protein
VAIKLLCPGNWPGRTARRCTGVSTLGSTKSALPYDIAHGRTQTVRFSLTDKAFRKLRKTRRVVLPVGTLNGAVGGSTPGRVTLVVRAPH